MIQVDGDNYDDSWPFARIPADGGWMGVLAAIAIILLFSFSFSWIWATLGLIMRTEKSLMMASTVILFPLQFISHVFVAPHTMRYGFKDLPDFTTGDSCTWFDAWYSDI